MSILSDEIDHLRLEISTKDSEIAKLTVLVTYLIFIDFWVLKHDVTLENGLKLELQSQISIIVQTFDDKCEMSEILENRNNDVEKEIKELKTPFLGRFCTTPFLLEIFRNLLQRFGI